MAPFGGRRVELQQLALWLQDRKAAPYALVEGEPGRGKTALLVRFAEYARTQCLADVVFVAINMRFGTTGRSVFLRSLLSQLALLRSSPPVPALGAEALSIEAQTALGTAHPGGSPLLVVIDGLDESEGRGWRFGRDFIFPTNPGDSVKILLSARRMAARDWMTDLGLSRANPGILRLHLQNFTRDEVEEVTRTTLPRLRSEKPQLGQLLYTISDHGDPLVLGLYLEDLLRDKRLAKAKSELQALATTPPGLGYFIDRLLREPGPSGYGSFPGLPGVEDILELLACALGPLSLTDLAALTEKLDSTWIQTEIERTGRVIIGDPNQGYALGHPRLQQFFIDRMKKRGSLQATQERLSKYCRQLLAEQTRAGAVLSSYVVRHLSAHLDADSAAPEEYYALLDGNRFTAWQRIDATHEGFLNDVQRAWRAAEEDGKDPSRQGPAAANQIRCALFTTSIQGLNRNLPARLLGALVREQIWSPAQALGHVRCVTDQGDRGEALIEIEPYLYGALLEQGIELLKTISIGTGTLPFRAYWSRLSRTQQETLLDDLLAQPHQLWWWHISHLAKILPTPQLSKILVAAQQIPGCLQRCTVLQGLLPYLSDGYRATAIVAWKSAAEGIPPPEQFSWILKLIAAATVPALTELLEGIWIELRAWPIRADYPSESLAQLLHLLPQLRSPMQPAVMDKARGLALDPDAAGGDEHLEQLARALVRRGLGQEILERIAQCRAEHVKARLCVLVAPDLDAAQRHMALQQVRALRNVFDRASALIALAASAEEEECERILNELTDERDQAGAPVVSDGLLASALPRLRGVLFDKVLRQVRALSDTHARSWNAGILLSGMNDEDRAREAEVILDALELRQRDEGWKRLLSLSVPYLSREQLARALQMARRLDDGVWQQHAVLACGAAALAGGAAPKPTMTALAAMLPQPKVGWLVRLLPELPEKERGASVKFAETQLQRLPASLPSLDARISLLPWQEARPLFDRARELMALIELTPLPRADRDYLRARLYAELGKLEDCTALRNELWSQLTHGPEASPDLWLRIVRDQVAAQHIAQALGWTRRGHALYLGWEDLVRKLAALGHIEDALAEARRADVARFACCGALVGVLEFVPSGQRRSVLREAQQLLDNLHAPRDTEIIIRAKLLPHLPSKIRAAALNRILELISQISSFESISPALKYLAPYLADLPKSQLFKKWSGLLHHLARGDRKTVLYDIVQILPMILKLRGPEDLLDTARDILNIGTWLP